MTPEWSDFKILLALARAGSMAGAARQLKVDNSTVSRRLVAMEDAVSAKLLIRGGREFTWTAEGRTLIGAGEAIEAAVAHALRAVRTAKIDVNGTVRVSVPPAFVPVLMRGVLPRLRRAHSSLRVELAGGLERANLRKGDADIAIRMTRPEEQDLVACHVFDCGWSAYAADSYLQARGRPASYEDLGLHELVLYTESMHRVAPLRWLETYRGEAREVSRVDNLEIACQIISAGGGIAVLPCIVGDAMAGLQRVFAGRVAVNRGWIVYHESARDTARVRVVVDALVGFFRMQEAAFSGCPAAVDG